MMVKLSEASRPAADHRRDIRGRRVVDSAGLPLGTVEDLLLDPDHRYRLFRIEHGGVTGFGATPSLIPCEVVRVTAREIRVARPAAQVADAPLYDPTLMDEAEYGDQLYGYYACAPQLLAA